MPEIFQNFYLIANNCKNAGKCAKNVLLFPLMLESGPLTSKLQQFFIQNTLSSKVGLHWTQEKWFVGISYHSSPADWLKTMKILANCIKCSFRAMLLSDFGIVEHFRPHHRFSCSKISPNGLLQHQKFDFHTFLNAVTVYTAVSVTCGWAGAVMSLSKPRNREIRDQKLDDTDQRTDRHSVL